MSATAIARIEVWQTELIVQPRAFWKRAVTVPWSDLRSLQLVGLPQGTMLVVEARKTTFASKSMRASDDLAFASVRDAVHEVLSSIDGGAAILRASEAEELRTSTALSRPVNMTPAIAFMFLLSFAMELYWGALHSPLELIRFGANMPFLVTSWQLYRLLSANFLHASWTHLLTNLFLYVVLATQLERLIGATGLLIITACSGAAGAALSASIGMAPLSIGASGCVYGVLGALGYLHVRRPREVPGSLRLRGGWWILAAVIMSPFPRISSRVDVYAHVGGLLGGAAVMAVRYWLPVPRRAVTETRFAALLVAAHAATLVFVVRDVKAHEKHTTQLLQAVFANRHPNVALMNEVLWQVAIDPKTSAPQLNIAERLGWHLLDASRQVSNANFDDTVAEIEHRLGKLDPALELSSRAFRASPKPYLAAQLTRFGLARRAASGVRFEGKGSAPIVKLLALSSKDASPRRYEVSIELGDVATKALAIDAAILGDDAQPGGMVELCVKGVASAKAELEGFRPAGTGGLPILIPFWIDEHGCGDAEAAVTMTARAFEHDPGAMLLP